MTTTQTPPEHVTLEKKTVEITKATRIAVIYGGFSQERPISLRSGQSCYDALERLGYENICLIDADHALPERLKEFGAEVAFLALHGRYGEDGSVQGLLEWMGIAYTGNRLLASALTMNKDFTRRILASEGLPVAPGVTFRLDLMGTDPTSTKRFQDTLAFAKDVLAFPVMVKPASEGSSIGMQKVHQPGKLQEAVLEAAQHDPVVVVEAFMQGKSLTVGVLETPDEIKLTPILELRPKTDWYDYDAKYTEGKTEFILPASLNEEETQLVQKITLSAHWALGCRGVSRIDFIYQSPEEFYILEVNTIPGMTTLSDLPAQAKTMGIEYDQLVETLLYTAAI